MDVAPRYLGGASFLGRRDPRVLILVPLIFMVAAAQLRDLRLVSAAAVVAFGYYAAARIPFAAVRKNWFAVLAFLVVVAGVNGLVVGAGSTGNAGGTTLWTVPLIGVPVTTVALSYAATLYVRFLAIVATGFPMAFAIRPGDLAVAFARLGIPAKLAVGIDLTFRFLPSTAADLRETEGAQRLRGFERGRSRNPITRLLRLRPLVVAATVNALLGAEDTVDALDLRGFGTQRRTWLRRLRFGPADWATVLAFALVAATVTTLGLAGALPGTWAP